MPNPMIDGNEGKYPGEEEEKPVTTACPYKVAELWVAKATELNRHTTRMKIRGSVVSLSFSFLFPHPPEDKKRKKVADGKPSHGLAGE